MTTAANSLKKVTWYNAYRAYRTYKKAVFALLEDASHDGSAVESQDFERAYASWLDAIDTAGADIGESQSIGSIMDSICHYAYNRTCILGGYTPQEHLLARAEVKRLARIYANSNSLFGEPCNNHQPNYLTARIEACANIIWSNQQLESITHGLSLSQIVNLHAQGKIRYGGIWGDSRGIAPARRLP